MLTTGNREVPAIGFASTRKFGRSCVPNGATVPALSPPVQRPVAIGRLLDTVRRDAEPGGERSDLIQGQGCVQRFSEHRLLMGVRVAGISYDKKFELLFGLGSQ